MPIATNPDLKVMGAPILFQSQPQVSMADIATDEFQETLETLKRKQFDANGIGIAAPQVGWAARVLCLGISDDNRERYPLVSNIPFQFWINPQITHFSKDTCWAWEGCLSVPGIRGWVNRPSAVNVCGYNQEGERIEVELDGFSARVMQHEIDHLDGVLFPMRMEETKLIIPNASMENQALWPEGWPTPHARITRPGEISMEK